MKENIETKDVQRTEYLDKNGLDMLWAKVKENTHNQVEVERDRATTQENRIIETKADKSELHSSYVSNSTFTALQEKVAANTDAISDKQDAGNYLSYETLNNEGYYEIPDIRIPGSGGSTKTDIDSQSISVKCDTLDGYTTITCDGISNNDNNANHVYATDGSIADLTEYIKIASNIITKGFGTIKTVDAINNNIGVGDNTSNLAYIGKGELGAIQYNSDGYATESFRYTTTYGLETTNTRGYKNVKIPCDQNYVWVYKSNSNDHYTKYGYSGVQLGENKDDSNLLNTNGSYKTIGTDITPLENGKVPAEYLDLSQYAKKSEIPEVDASNFVSKTATDAQIIKSELTVKDNLRVAHDNTNEWFTNINYDGISVVGNDGKDIYINQNDCIKVSAQIDPYWIYSKMDLNEMYLHGNTNSLRIGLDSIKARRYSEHSSNQSDTLFILSEQGVSLYNGDNNHVLTSGGSTIDITQYALKSVYDEKIAALEARIAALEAKHTETA